MTKKKLEIPTGMKPVEVEVTRFVKESEQRFNTHKEAKTAAYRLKPLEGVRVRVRRRQDHFAVVVKKATKVKTIEFVKVLDDNIPRIQSEKG